MRENATERKESVNTDDKYRALGGTERTAWEREGKSSIDGDALSPSQRL